MIVFPDRLELSVILGLDIAQPYFRATKTNVSAGPNPTSELPLAAADRLVELKSGDQRLHPTAFSGIYGMQEVTFLITFPRPAAGPLKTTFLFFDLIPDLREGTFAVIDDLHNHLGSALLSPKSPTLEINLLPPGEAPSPSSAANPTDADSPTAVANPRPSFGDFCKLGVEHILKGFDHLLFLGALLVGLKKVKPMLAIVTCFTLAHSVTLALAALDLVQLSPRVVEPLIAASIIIVGAENLMRKDAISDRYWMAAGFGLIHGFGFAAVLRETGLSQPGTSIVAPLLGFNLGVEIGQLLIAALTVPLLLFLRRTPAFTRYVSPALSALIIVISTYWLIQRTVV